MVDGCGGWLWWMVVVDGCGGWLWWMVVVDGCGGWLWWMVVVIVMTFIFLDVMVVYMNKSKL